MAILIALILWFMLSFVIANAASQRGRGAFAWFLFSILTTPILAALFLLLFPPITQQTKAPLYAANDRAQSKVLESDEPPRPEGAGTLGAAALMLLVVLAGIGFLIIERLNKPEAAVNSLNEAAVSALPAPRVDPYEVAARASCRDLLKVLDDSRYVQLIDPVVEFMGQHEDLGTRVNRTSYLLTECRLRENQTIGAAVNSLFEQKRLARLPQIPIGGATSDAYVQAIWIPFDKWIRHQGPRPNFAAAIGR